ncbi:ATP-dependent nuclease [Serratia marcescens]|uniref:ATP-dependent nuclease n=1 Tax=Serratia marcescens TaxID=615 RepID=UPI0029EC1DA5|nr:AAA family ATPase [Serratia marcescens]
MLISQVDIKNYRCFDSFTVKLNQLTIIIGENNSGKTNFIKALSLPLSSGSLDFSQKRLSISDFNNASVIEFLECAYDYFRLGSNEKLQEDNVAKILELFPVVEVTLEFSDPKNNYEKALISSFLDEDGCNPVFRISYSFYPKDEIEFLGRVEELVLSVSDKKELKWNLLPIDNYEYDIKTTANNKSVSISKLKNILINIIGAERDDFSDSQTMKSNSLLTRLLISELNGDEKKTINSAYSDFFNEVENAGFFQRMLNSDHSFDNIKEHLKELGCVPNLPNLKNILSNITLSYGSEFLYQKGLGERNLVYIFLFFAYFKKNNKEFNLCCVEEPEAHLGVNKLRSVTDFIEKSTSEVNSLLQTIVTSHSPSIINKLKISNVVAFSGNKAVSLSEFGSDLNDYLRKRPNFDILRLLYADKLILVEGPSEEMLIRSHLYLDNNNLNDIEIISVGQKGYRKFLDIWLLINKDNYNKKIGVIRDFDNQPNAQSEHEKYTYKHPNIKIETTMLYTLEDDLVNHGSNIDTISDYFCLDRDDSIVSTFLKSDKTGGMLALCDAMTNKDKQLKIKLPPHIERVLEELK